MKKILPAIGCFLLLFSLILSDVYAKSRKATITFKRGLVQIKKRGSTRWNNFNPAMILSEGDKVKTGRKSKVEIRFDDGSRIKLLSNSVIELKKYYKIDDGRYSMVKLKKGKLFGNVLKLRKKSKFQVSAVNSTAGVRGTEFYVAIDNRDNVTVEVNNGSLDVEAEGTKVVVTDLKGTYIKKGEAPTEPKNITKRKVQWGR